MTPPSAFCFHSCRSLSTFLLLVLLVTKLVSNCRASDPLNNIFSGLTYTRCARTNDCRNFRSCTSSNRLNRCDAEVESSCLCVPDHAEFVSCSSHQDCRFGEMCARSRNNPPICVATEGAVGDWEPIGVARENSSIPLACPAPPPGEAGSPATSQGERLTFDSCRSTTDCSGDRQCLANGLSDCCPPATQAKPGHPGPQCVCMPPYLTGCGRDSDCADGEGCVRTYVDAPRCISHAARDRLNAPNEFLICIAEHHLRHFPTHDFVFGSHKAATVLCDKHMSCATPGHMVAYRERAMMMKTYCKAVGCTPQRMLVNSIRYTPGRVVDSHTEELRFFALAASYETAMEEFVLSTAVRLGL